MANSGSSTGGGATSGAIRAGRAFVEIFADSTKLERDLKVAESRVKSFAGMMAKAGAATAAAGAAILAPLTLAASDTVDKLSAIKKVADIFGDSVENVSALASVVGDADVKFEDFADSLSHLPEHLDDAAHGSDETAATFRRLGIDARSLARLPLTDQLAAIADGFASTTDATARASIATKLFRAEGQQLLPLLTKGGAALRDAMADAKAKGGGFTTEDAEVADKVSTAYKKLTGAAKSVMGEVGRAVLYAVKPATAYLPIVTTLVSQSKEWVRSNYQVVATVVGVGVALSAAGAALALFGAGTAALGSGLGAVATVVGVVTSAIAFLLTPVGAATAVVVAATAAFGYLLATTEKGQTVVESFGAYWSETGETIKATWQGVVDALMAGDLELAGRIALAGLKVEFERAKGWVSGFGSDFKEHFVEGWFDGIYLARTGWNSFQASIQHMWIGLMRFLNENFTDTFGQILSDLGDAVSLIDRDLGASLKALSRSTYQEMRDALTAADAEVDKERGANQDRITRDTQNADEQRRAARQRGDNQAGIDAAIEEWEDLLADAEDKRTKAAKKIVGGGPPPMPTFLSGSRGLFAFGDSSIGAFAANKATVEQLIANEAKKQTKLLVDIKDGIDDLAENAAVYT